MDPLKLYLDTLEPRVRYEPLNAIFTCSQSDILYSGTAISVDFVTDTGMLRPLPETPEWGSVFTGDYYRYRKADYTLVSPNAWVDKQVGTAGNYYLQSLNINEIVYTTQTWPMNQPVYLSWYVYGVGSERHVIMECGWTDPSNSVSLRYWSDGKVEVWKGGSVVGGGNIIDDVVYYANPYGSGYAPYSVKGRNQTLERIQVYMVPCRQRELLVLSNAGGGFNHAFDDLVIDPNIQTPGTVTEEGRFWWLVPEGQAEVQFAPLKFKTAGTVWSAPLKLRYPPQTGSTVNYSLYWSGPGIGSVSAVGTVIDASSGSAFSANGTVDTVRLGMVLSGDGSATPYAYGMRATFSGSVTTAGTSSPFDATPYVLSDGLEVTCGEHYSGNRVEARLHSPGTMDLNYSGNGYALNNTSFEVRGGTSTPVVMAGRIDGQTWEEQGVGGQDRARLHTLTGRDWWKTFEGWPQVDPFPLDAFRLDVAIGTLVSLAGYGSAYQSISTVDFHLPSTPAASRGEWASMPETGETIADTLRRMHEDYAATHVMGWRPTSGGTPTFQFAGTADIGTVASATVFPSLGSAQAAGYTVDPYRYVYTSYQERILEPEANDTWAIGRDPRTGTVIAAHYEDVVSQDPTLHAAARPDNWLGERRRYVLVDPSITEQVVANWAVATLGPRLAQTRYISQWECNDWVARTDGAPVWRGDVVQLSDQGRFRVISAGLKTTYEGTVYDTVRRATYVGEWIGPSQNFLSLSADTFTGTNGATIDYNAGYPTLPNGAEWRGLSYASGYDNAYITSGSVTDAGFLTSAGAIALIDNHTSDLSIYADMTYVGATNRESAYLLARAYGNRTGNTTARWYRAGYNGASGRWEVEAVGGSGSAATTTEAISAGTTYALEFRVTDATKTLYVNGSAAVTLSDSSLAASDAANNRCGFLIVGSPWHATNKVYLDNWRQAYNSAGKWILAQDAFTGGSANLSAHTPDIGPYWQQAATGTAIIDGSGNARSLEQVAAAGIRYRVITPKAWRDMEVRSSMVLGSAAVETGLLARYANDSNRYEFVWANFATPYVRLARRRMGTYAIMRSYTTLGLAAGATVDVALRCVGANITPYVNGTALETFYDPSLMIAGYPGIQISNGTAPVSAMTLYRDFTCEGL